MQPTGRSSTFASRRAKSCRSNCNARWSRGWSDAYRRGACAWRTGDYYLAHSARGDMCRRLGRTAEARPSYEKALALTAQEPERKFLRERLRQLK
ncbi:MAG: tetratricopeptide repeat protein [Acidobacteriaceae bacterium]